MHRASFLVVALIALLLAAPAGAAEDRGGAIGAIAGHGQSGPDDAIVVVNGDVTIERGEFVEGVFIAHGDARIVGRVDGDVVVASGDALVRGRIGGNLVTFSGQARLLPSARVGGDVKYGDERPTVSTAAVVGGDVQKENWNSSLDFLPFIGAFILWFAITVSSVVLGGLLLLIAPRAADAIATHTRKRTGPTIAIGLAIFIVLPLTAFISAITVLGLPLALGLFLALAPIYSVAYVTAAWALGRAIVKPPRERILSFLAGLAILRALALVPILGLIVWVAAAVFGLGLIGAAIGAARSEPAEAGAPAHSE
jgi:cytoskeletal protein CcmA (bactofilin family)